MYRNLDPEKIAQTIGRLRDRIAERFPDSSLSRIAGEVVEVTREAVTNSEWAGRPHLGLRFVVALLTLAMMAIFVGGIVSVKFPNSAPDFFNLLQLLEAGLNDLVFIGAAIFFLFTLESRLKRRRVLKALHELRSLAHIVDIHQLTKDPERLLQDGQDTASSPKRTMSQFELSRYLDYCSEMLSLIGKVAALYVQKFDDPVVLAAVDEVEDLTTGLSRKIWQKITILERLRETQCPPR